MNDLYVKYEEPVPYGRTQIHQNHDGTPNTVTKEEQELFMGIRGTWPNLWTSVPEDNSAVKSEYESKDLPN